MLKVVVDYPTRDQELEILKRMAITGEIPSVQSVATPDDILEAKKLVGQIQVTSGFKSTSWIWSWRLVIRWLTACHYRI